MQTTLTVTQVKQMKYKYKNGPEKTFPYIQDIHSSALCKQIQTDG